MVWERWDEEMSDYMLNHDPKVMLFCPVRLRTEQIPDMLRTHRELDGYEDMTVVYVDDCEPDGSELLMTLVDPNVSMIGIDGIPGNGSYSVEDHNWVGQNVSRIAHIRNLAIQHFLATDCTHLFMVDADLLLHPRTVKALLAAGKPVVSEVFWSQWPGDDKWMPNVWEIHPYGFTSPESILRLVEPGVYEVSGLGACTLFERAALKRGVDYSPIGGCDIAGEDRWFCIRCAVDDIPLHVDTNYPAFHVYRGEQLEEARKWRDGSDTMQRKSSPSYFRYKWLVAEWENQIRRMFQEQLTDRPKPSILAVCLPGESFSSLWVGNWTTLHGALTRARVIVLPFFAYASNVYVTRGCLWNSVRESTVTGANGEKLRPDFVLWVDDDQLITPEMFDMLVKDLNENPHLDMVAGWSWCQPDGYAIRTAVVSAGWMTRQNLCEPMVHSEMMSRPVDVVEVDYTGFPMVLMRGRMLDMMGEVQNPFAAVVDDALSWGMAGEDVSFCIRAVKAGCRIGVDRRVKVPHLKLRQAEPSPDGLTPLSIFGVVEPAMAEPAIAQPEKQVQDSGQPAPIPVAVG